MEYIISKTVGEFTALKFLWSAIMAVFCFFFNELYAVGVVAVSMLMVFDALTGILASWQEGKEISSQKFVRSVKKGIVYFISISAGHFVDQTIIFETLKVVEVTMISFVAFTEFVSINENMSRMGYQTPKKLLNQLKAKYE